MKQTSLEDEKRALLDQIHSSRETYRRMLKHDARDENIIEGNVVNIGHMDRFPRSMTMRWIVQHPYMSAAAVAAVALLGTRSARTAITDQVSRVNRRLHANAATMRPAMSHDVAGSRRTARTRSTDFQASGNMSRPMSIARSMFTGLITAGAMLLRDPRKMKAASNAFSAAAKFVRERRPRRSNQRAVQVVHVKEE